MATAIGNGWAYEQLNGRIDTAAWYADDYINGFAQALYPMVKVYLRERPSGLIVLFINAAIEAFAKTFPTADHDVAVLLNSVGIYADTEDDELLTAYSQALLSRFRVASSYLRAPLHSTATLRTLSYPQLTKVIIVDRDREARWNDLGNQYLDVSAVDIPRDRNFYYAFYDDPSRSVVLIFLVEGTQRLNELMETLKQERQINFGEVVSLGAEERG